MGIFDGIEQDVRGRGSVCRVEIVRGKLDKDDAAAFQRVITDAALPATVIARRLQAAGHTIRDESIARHRRGECACAR